MAGRGPAPKDSRSRRNTPERGEWVAVEGEGWQHGDIPPAPDGLTDTALDAWETWFRAWFAAHWTPDDLPGLTVVVQLYDECQRAFDDPFIATEDAKGKTVFVRRPNPTTELRQMLDNYGITPKGQQDRRWKRPERKPKADTSQESNRYAHLQAVRD